MNKQLEENLPLILEHISGAFFILDAEGRFLFLNSAACEFFGVPQAELIGKKLIEERSPCSIQCCYLQIKTALDTRSDTKAEIYCSHRKEWLYLRLKPTKSGPQAPSLILVNLWDISERKATQQKLLQLSRAVEHSPASVIITDSHGIIEYVNPKFTSVTGYSPEEVIGKNPSILKSGLYPNEAYEEMWKTISSGKEWRGEFHNRKKNGELFWEMVAISPIMNSDGTITHFIAVKEDVTERKSLEDQCVRAKEVAETANRAKSTFLANMSHELRTPLNGILGFADLLEGQFFGPLNPRQTEYLREIGNCGKSLLSVINDLLDIAKIDSGGIDIQKEEVRVQEFFDSTAAMVKSQLQGKKLELVLNISPALPVFLVDRRKLRQILINLLGHSIKVSNEGGRIEIHGEPLERYFHIRIVDFGPPITPDEQEKIFSEVYLPNPMFDQGGAHIKLALAKRLAEIHGGIAGFESITGKGNSFSVKIPLSTRDTEDDSLLLEPKATSGTLPILKPHRILIAEDNEVNLHILTALLKIQNHEIIVARNGREAVEKTICLKPDIVLMDIIMPVMGGIEATKQIRANPDFDNLPIIAITANSEPESQKECLMAGCSAILTKPLHLRQVILTLKAFLDKAPPKTAQEKMLPRG